MPTLATPPRRTFKVYDRVKIAIPEMFVRVGYPWDKEYVRKNHVTPEMLESLRNTFRAFGLSPSDYGGHFGQKFGENKPSRRFAKVLDELCHGILHREHFGGSRRMLHTEFRAELAGVTATVLDKKIVKTGTYIPGYSGGPWDYDAESPSLSAPKTHVILRLRLDGQPFLSSKDEGPQIEQIHVEHYHGTDQIHPSKVVYGQ